ncbi:unnamed protein product [Gongylonema pulchrum]|uniref:DOCKER domain-containing protein n=1 Tax=Gongylonema pulchrum TaxID=637853 RepID=A0A183E1Z4_9BILA|nr:unnamed protein product [Gongylonema pulchrum]
MNILQVRAEITMNNLAPETALHYEIVRNAALAELKENDSTAAKAFNELAEGVFQRSKERVLEFGERVETPVRRSLLQENETQTKFFDAILCAD